MGEKFIPRSPDPEREPRFPAQEKKEEEIPEEIGTHPKEEEMKKERMPEKIELSEAREKEWARLKRVGAFWAIQEGKRIGIPPEELDRFAQEVIAERTKDQDYGFIFHFRGALGMGTEEELRKVGELAYQRALEENPISAADIAKKLYGENSPEYRKAMEVSRQKREKEKRKMERKEEKELEITLPRNATFADLFNALDEIEKKEGLGEVQFEEELHDHFGEETVEEILAFQDNQARAASTKVIDFFKEHGYTQRDVSTYLPIKFKRERKSKQ